MRANEKAFLWEAGAVVISVVAIGLEYIALFGVGGRLPLF